MVYISVIYAYIKKRSCFYFLQTPQVIGPQFSEIRYPFPVVLN